MPKNSPEDGVRSPRCLFPLLAVFALLVVGPGAVVAAGDPLPSWRDGESKRAIVEFVSAVTAEGSATYVPEPERIATFDNDGTLWIEKPIYTQVSFILDRIRELASEHPEWQDQAPFQAAIDFDKDALAAIGTDGLKALAMGAQAEITDREYAAAVSRWIAEAKHPRFERLYTELVYAPMLELLDYLRANGFETHIVSGGGVDFMRPWTEAVYGIPPQHVIGSQIGKHFEIHDGEPVLMRDPEIFFIDDKAGKPVGIARHIGRRPILAFGNSDGDLQMLQWTTAGEGRRLGLILRHDDAEREYAYDRDSAVGRLDKAMDEAPEAGWVLVSMKDDWVCVFPKECGVER
jgi:phosphoserine phosphatase